nr:MAG TPA: hypothetical protein [Caudoviricetes sp.]
MFNYLAQTLPGKRAMGLFIQKKSLSITKRL